MKKIKVAIVKNLTHLSYLIKIFFVPLTKFVFVITYWNVVSEYCVDKNMVFPQHCFYSIESRRLSSFRTWPKGLTQKPQDMADAGFYYTGEGDRVICYFCDGKLKDWSPSDRPWIEHARFFHTCPYVLIMKGEEYVQRVRSMGYENDEFISCDELPKKENDNKLTTNVLDITCKICLEIPVSTCFTPCGHAVACTKCALSIHKKCPICRKAYIDIIRLYF